MGLQLPFLVRLQDDLPIVFDGGQGSELERRGVNVKHSLWSSLPFIKNDEADLLRAAEMYHDFRNSGSELVNTLTYQASYDTMLEHSEGLVGNLEEYYAYLDHVVRFTREHSSGAYICGSIGPYASYLGNGAEYTGDYSSAKPNYMDYYRAQTEYFVSDERIDVIGFETIPNIDEFVALIGEQFSQMIGKEKPFFVSICTDENGFLRDGTDVDTLCQKIKENESQLGDNFVGFGINCVSYESSGKILACLNAGLKKSHCKSRFNIVYPNSGEVYIPETYDWKPNPNLAEHETWEYMVENYLKEDCKIIGGCCRTTPEDIMQISAALAKKDKD